MRVVAIVAEAGFGKTRLLDEFLHGIDGDTPVLRATCFQGEVAIPHSLTVGLLRAAVDDAGDEIAHAGSGSAGRGGTAATRASEPRSTYRSLRRSTAQGGICDSSKEQGRYCSNAPPAHLRAWS